MAHPFYQQQDRERAERDRQSIAYLEGYCVGRGDSPPRQPTPDFRASYEKGVANGRLARTMKSLVVVTEAE